MKKLILLTFLISALVGQTGFEIAKMVDEKPSPVDMSNKTSMILTNKKGKTRTNAMMSKSMDGNKKQIIWFLEPKDDKGVAFLKIEHDDKDDEMRMWLPAFKKVTMKRWMEGIVMCWRSFRKKKRNHLIPNISPG